VTHETIILGRETAIKIMAISVLLKDGELALVGDDAHLAYAELCDVGEEIALQLEGYPA